jgi:hypothetical protein
VSFLELRASGHHEKHGENPEPGTVIAPTALPAPRFLGPHPSDLTNFPSLLSSRWQSCNPFIGSIPPLTRTRSFTRSLPAEGCRLKVLL